MIEFVNDKLKKFDVARKKHISIAQELESDLLAEPSRSTVGEGYYHAESFVSVSLRSDSPQIETIGQRCIEKPTVKSYLIGQTQKGQVRMEKTSAQGPHKTVRGSVNGMKIPYF